MFSVVFCFGQCFFFDLSGQKEWEPLFEVRLSVIFAPLLDGVLSDADFLGDVVVYYSFSEINEVVFGVYSKPLIEQVPSQPVFIFDAFVSKWD